MRQIDRDAIRAFQNDKEFKRSNTCVKMINGKPHLYLHHNLIAKKDENGELLIRHAGWQTVTTMSRLNAFVEVRIRCHKGNFILNEMTYMNDDWYNIDKL